MLNLSDCKVLKEMPERLHEMFALESLNLTRCVELTKVPASMSRLQHLRSLDMEECTQLTSLPDIKSTRVLFPHLEYLNLNRCDRIAYIPSWVTEAERRGGAVIRPANYGEFNEGDDE